MHRRSRVAMPALAAVAGVVASHIAGYVLLFPHSAERDAHLSATGHDYWPAAVVLAVAAGTAAVVTAVAAGARRGLVDKRSAQAQPLVSFAGLAAWQITLFALIEVLERLHAGVPPSALLHSPDMALGLAVQGVIAATAAWLLCRATSLAERVARAFRSRPIRLRPVLFPMPAVAGPAPFVVGAAAQPRAPPLLDPH